VGTDYFYWGTSTLFAGKSPFLLDTSQVLPRKSSFLLGTPSFLLGKSHFFWLNHIFYWVNHIFLNGENPNFYWNEIMFTRVLAIKRQFHDHPLAEAGAFVEQYTQASTSTYTHIIIRICIFT
jgi:hypothetical protein